MNKIHNIIWSKAQNAWIVVSEGSKSRSKSSSRGLRSLAALLLLSPTGIFAATLPSGGAITLGQGSIAVSGDQMVIKQATDKLGINWQSFNVGADGKVIFDQPGTQSIALNRVIGSDGSSILGKIEANGQVFLINPNGVIFGKNSKVSVGGLVASTLDISDEDFKNGNYKLSASHQGGEIINNGTLQSAEGGYIALLGRSVKNNGLIKAQLGTAAMASGDALTLDFSGDGLVNVQVSKSSLKALVDNQGVIKADGGSVLMTARATNALIDTVVNNDGIIQAQTLNMRAGKIMLDGGPVDGSGVVSVGGTLDASAPGGGSGGFIETSGKTVVVKESAVVTTKASTGHTGEWLIDPSDFTVSSGTAPSTSSGIGSKTLADALAKTNVTLATASTGSEEGNLTINGAVAWSANTTLTLKAHKSVIINSDVAINGDAGGISINYGLGGDPLSTLQINGGSGTLTLNGGNNTFAINGTAYTVIDDLASLRALSDSPVLNGHYVLGKNINAQTSSSWNAGLGFDPIGDASHSFTGVFEGLNHRITNLTINRPTDDYVGFFATTNGAKISGLSLTGTVKGHSNVGFLAGLFNNSSLVAYDIGSSSYSISNFTGDVTANGNVGGVLGQSSGSTLLSVQYTGTILAGSSSNVGGIFGLGSSLNGKYLYNAGVINGGDNTGGVGGSLSGTSKMISIRNLGSVTGASRVGGLFGALANSSLDTAWSSGSISASGDRSGGLVGSSTQNQVSKAYSTGSVSAANRYAGGIIGYDTGGSTVSETFATSPVSAQDYAGGLLGYASNANISNSYATGVVSGANSAGLVSGLDNSTLSFVYATGSASSGLVAQSTLGGNSVNEAFWDVTRSGAAGSLLGVQKTTAQMNAAATFSNWGVDLVGNGGGIWRMYEGQGAPLLKFRLGNGLGYTTVKQTDNGSTYAGRELSATELATLGISNGSGLIFWGAYTPITGSQTSGGTAIRDAGVYTLDKMYSDQFGFNLYQSKPVTVTVAKADLNVIATAPGKTYDGSTSASVILSDNRIGSDDLDLSYANAFYDTKNAGSNKVVSVQGINVTGADAKNYNWNSLAVTFADIAKANLVVGAVAQDKIYDGSDQASVVLSDNRIAGDNLTFSSSSSFSDKNAGAGKTVNVSNISAEGTDANNYIWNKTALAEASIGKASLTVTASGVDRVYDGTKDVSVQISDDRVSGDLITITASAEMQDKSAGSGKAVSVSGINVTGADAQNYAWNTTASTTADIAKANLLVSASGIDKTYNGSVDAEVSYSDSRIAGDSLAVTGSSTFADKNAGSNKTVTVYGISITGADAENYSWNTSTSTSADIAKAVLAVGAVGQDKIYDGLTGASASFTDNRVGLDDLSISGTGLFVDKNAGVGKTITVSGINVTGADAGNYTWNSTALTTAEISRANLVVTAAASDKIYDGTALAHTDLTDNRITGDDLLISSNSSTFSDKNAGAGKAVSVSGITISGEDANNYTVNASTTASASITKANLVVQAQDSSKLEGEQDGHLNWSLSSGSLYGDDSIIGSLSRDAGEAVGSYDIHQGDLTAGSNYSFTVLPGSFKIIAPWKPPVVIDPPVPPTGEPGKPVSNVDLDSAKDIVSTVSVASQSARPRPDTLLSANSDPVKIMSDYRLLNLGMKLPDEILSYETQEITDR